MGTQPQASPWLAASSASGTWAKPCSPIIRDGHGQIQLYLRKDELGDDAYADLLKLSIWAISCEATGTLFRTKTGEVSVRATSLTMLSKALNAPPEKWHGLQDIEIRYRQRYLDLLANEETRRVFAIRSKIVTAFRSFLDARDYIEVETPVLQPLYGGAAARPFTTHHNALGQTFYLRIADELYLKRLLVGGFERVYEIAKDFRNEGIDKNHSPEFTMLEFYEAFADYEKMMETVEQMIHHTGCRSLRRSSLHQQRQRRSTSRRRGRARRFARRSSTAPASTTWTIRDQADPCWRQRGPPVQISKPTRSGRGSWTSCSSSSCGRSRSSRFS